MAPGQVNSLSTEGTATLSPDEGAGGPSTPTTPAAASNDNNDKKRKAPREYSTNPHTVRVRERNASLNPYQLAVERARSNDLKAVTSVWKARADTETYRSADEDTRRKMLEEAEQKVMACRRRKKIDLASKIMVLNQKYGPDGEAAAAAAALCRTAVANNGSVPDLAPPGYLAYPPMTIAALMDNGKGKKAATEAATAAAPGGSQAGPSDAVQATPTSVTAAQNNAELVITQQELMETIEELLATKEELKITQEDLKATIKELNTNIQELHGAVEDVGTKVQQVMAMYRSLQASRAPVYNHRAPAPPVSNYQAPPSQMSMLPAGHGYGDYQYQHQEYNAPPGNGWEDDDGQDWEQGF